MAAPVVLMFFAMTAGALRLPRRLRRHVYVRLAGSNLTRGPQYRATRLGGIPAGVVGGYLGG